MFFDIEKVDPERTVALQEDGRELTYGELVCFCGEIQGLVPKRSLVFSLCHNVTGSLAGYVAFLSAGIVPLLLSEDIDTDLLDELLKTYEPQFVWCPAGKADLTDGNRVYEKYGYVLLERGTKSPDMYEELALLLTTSGSTGSPKLVRQSYKNILSNAGSIAQYLELDETERPITMLPMNYTYGLSVINSHLTVGATILMTDTSYAQRAFWDFFKREGATSIVGVPYTYELLKKLRFFQMQLPSLRYMTQAGGKLLPGLHREFAEYAEKNDKRFYVMYGQTEATARMSYLPYRESLRKYGSMGIAIPGGEFYLRDVDGSTIDKPFVTGELIYKGDNVTLGYAQVREDLKKGDEWHGVLQTGDMAQVDEDGYYTIVGRKKRFLKIYGNRVNLDECERMIQEYIKDTEVACVGRDDHMKIYVTKDNCEEGVLSFISEKTGLNRKAFEVLFIEKIPKNQSGKKVYSELNGGSV